MKSTRLGRVSAISAAGMLLLSSCAANESAAPAASGDASASASSLSGTLTGSGSSAQAAAQEVWVSQFQTANEGVTVEYESAGSGPGREAFLAGGTDFAGSDRAYNDEEVAAGGFASCAADSGIVELPLYVSPIAVIFNLEGIDTLDLDAATIAGIFSGTITSWDAPEIAEQNPDVDLPSDAITPVHRSDDSGTTENFTEYLGAVAPDVWTYEADGVWPISNGEAANGTTGLVGAVTQGTGTIGYADASRAGDLGTVAVQVGDDYVEYSPEAAAAIVDASPFAEGRDDFDLAVEIDRTTEEAGVYPIVLVSYVIGCETYEDSAKAELAKAYFTYLASEEGQAVASEAAGSAPISSTLTERVTSAIAVIS